MFDQMAREYFIGGSYCYDIKKIQISGKFCKV